MAFSNLPAQYVFLFYLTVVLLAVKTVIMINIMRRIITDRKKTEKVPLDFLYALFFFMLSLFVSRVFFVVFDFFTTGFDMDLYTITFNIFLHKAGQFISIIGMAFMLWVADKRIMLNKFKGIPAMILFIGALIVAIFPIREGHAEDFELYSFICVLFQLPWVVVFGIFVWMGVVAPRLRKIAWLFALACVIYTIAALIVNASIITPLESALGSWVPYLVYTIAISLKVAAICMMAYGAFNFMQLNSAMVDYYQSKRICVVHRGIIKGRVFMCGNCRIFYCIDCKNAIVDLENKCWNCGDVLSRGRELPKDDDITLNGNSKKKAAGAETGEEPSIMVDSPDKEPGKAQKKGVVAGEELSKDAKMAR